MVEIAKASVGRPQEETLVRINLKHYRREAKFKRKLAKLFGFWERVVVAKAKGHPKYLGTFEALFGEILDKYGELSRVKQKRAFRTRYPLRLISKLTNLNIVNVFPKSEDSKAFKEVLLFHKFKRDSFTKRE